VKKNERRISEKHTPNGLIISTFSTFKLTRLMVVNVHLEAMSRFGMYGIGYLKWRGERVDKTMAAKIVRRFCVWGLKDEFGRLA
jgi:hypothetical protein